jgi:hypothetical protein
MIPKRSFFKFVRGNFLWPIFYIIIILDLYVFRYKALFLRDGIANKSGHSDLCTLNGLVVIFIMISTHEMIAYIVNENEQKIY